MFIKYNDTNCHALPHLSYRQVTLKNKSTGKKRTVNKLETNQAPQDIQWLRPGWNEFPSAIWAQNKDHPQILMMLKKKKIELMHEQVTIIKGGKKVTKHVGQADEQVRLKWFTSARALEIVKDTYNRELLQRWLDEETRSSVKRKIEKQIEPLRAKGDEDSAADDDSGDDESAAE